MLPEPVTKMRICLAADSEIPEINFLSVKTSWYRYLLQSPVPVNKLSHLSMGPGFSDTQVSVREARGCQQQAPSGFSS